MLRGMTEGLRALSLLKISLLFLFVGCDLAAAAKVDPRIGIVHVAGQYPDRSRHGDFLTFGVDVATSLGFSSIELFLDPRICKGRNERQPFGLYQNTQFCLENKPNWMRARSLKELAEHPQFRAAFGNEKIERYFLSIDALDRGAANAPRIRRLERPWGKRQKKLLYLEVKDLTEYLIAAYGGTGKTFILSAPSEMDWLLTNVGEARNGCNKRSRSCWEYDANSDAVRNTIQYLKTIAQAISDGKKEMTDQNKGDIQIHFACEINFVVRVPQHRRTGLTEVIPNSDCDMTQYSAHELWRAIVEMLKQNPTDVSKNQKEIIEFVNATIQRIERFTPDHPVLGNKNIIIGEIGYRSNAYPDRPEWRRYYVETLKALLDSGVYAVNLWQLFDNICKKYNPSAAEFPSTCSGFGLMEPSERSKSGFAAGELLPVLLREFESK